MKNNVKTVENKKAVIDNQLEQYYTKASGCSVKPQEKNLYDYKPMLKENRNYLGLIKNDAFISKAEKKINDAILKITMKIKEQFPELSKYALEMPITVPNVENPKINLKVLQDYYKSLEELMQKYVSNQTAISK